MAHMPSQPWSIPWQNVGSQVGAEAKDEMAIGGTSHGIVRPSTGPETMVQSKEALSRPHSVSELSLGKSPSAHLHMHQEALATANTRPQVSKKGFTAQKNNDLLAHCREIKFHK